MLDYHTSKRGFTFFELLLAVAILSVGLTQIFRIFFGSVSALSHIQNRMHALLILDEVHLDAIEHINADSIAERLILRDKKRGNPDFKTEVVITLAPHTRNLYSVAMNVQWVESGKDKSISRQAAARQF